MPFNELQDEEFKSSTIEEKILSDNATTYVSGYLLKKCFEKHSCQTCYSVLVNNRLDSSDKLLCYFKAYETTKQPFGGLTIPHVSFTEYITKAEKLFVDTFLKIISKPSIGKQLISIIPKFQIKECGHFPSKFLVELFVRMRLHYIIKFGNRDLTQAKRKGKNRKYFKVSHL